MSQLGNFYGSPFNNFAASAFANRGGGTVDLRIPTAITVEYSGWAGVPSATEVWRWNGQQVRHTLSTGGDAYAGSITVTGYSLPLNSIILATGLYQRHLSMAMSVWQATSTAISGTWIDSVPFSTPGFPLVGTVFSAFRYGYPVGSGELYSGIATVVLLEYT